MTEEKNTKRVITKPGTVRVVVTLSLKDHDNLTAEADGRSINDWASRILKTHCDGLRKES